jgi:hypothetical protein
MKRTVRLFLVPVAILTFAMAGFAQDSATKQAAPGATEKKGEAKPQPKQRVKPSVFEGNVAAIDLKAGTLKVRARDGKEQTFTVEGAITKARLEKARVGHVIRVGYVEKEGKLVATGLKGGLGGHEGGFPMETQPTAEGTEKQEKGGSVTK